MYGRDGELTKLNAVRNDPSKSKWARNEADKAHRAITDQLKDKKLMAMRERLIRASQAGDRVEMARIGALMKDHEGKDTETGHYGI